jgi:hypothetical protein
LQALVTFSVMAGPALGQASPAQQTPAIPPLVVSVRVIDSTGVAVEGADAAILVGLNEAKATGTTDPSGHVSLMVTQPQGDYQLVVRKIGYNRTDQFFQGKSGRLAFDVVMHRTTQSLAPVTVTAQEDLKRKSYFIDADEIARHADELFDASDILRKLKPDMICGRVCDPWGAGVPPSVRTAARACPISNTNPGGCPRTQRPVGAGSSMSRTNAWVNGKRILTIDTDPACQAGKRGPLAGLSAGTMQVLCEIRPEHIEQIKYIDDWDNSVGKVGSNNALFIVLKEGVVYEPGEASYVRDAAAPLPGVRAALPGVQTMASATPVSLDVPPRHDSTTLRDSTTAVHDSAAALPLYRYRFLGVYDQESGDPVEGAKVVDVKTGTYTNTTATGTVSLLFLPEGGSLLRISKAGYDDVNLSVDIGPTSMTPLTLLMKKKS